MLDVTTADEALLASLGEPPPFSLWIFEYDIQDVTKRAFATIVIGELHGEGRATCDKDLAKLMFRLPRSIKMRFPEEGVIREAQIDYISAEQHDLEMTDEDVPRTRFRGRLPMFTR